MTTLATQMTPDDLDAWLVDPARMVLLDAVHFIGDVASSTCWCSDLPKEAMKEVEKHGVPVECTTCRAHQWLLDHGLQVPR